MVGLRKLKGLYYARVYLKGGNGKWKEKLVPLRTNQIVQAEVRRTEVQRFERLIKAGGDFIPSWKNNGKAEVIQYTLPNAITDFIKARTGDGLRAGTIDIYQRSLDALVETAGKRLPVKDFASEHIDKYKARFIKLSPVSLNIRLRSIKTFMFWLKDRGKIERVPSIKQQFIAKSKPLYLSNDMFKKILEMLNDLKLSDQTEAEHMKRAFRFYRETGLRRSEPFNAIINGNEITIPADSAKGRNEHEIDLNDDQIDVLLEMRERVDAKVKRLSKGKKYKAEAIKYNAISRYSRLFQASCKEAGITGRKFHSLRHTCAIRLYYAKRDIFAVMKQLNHSSIETTMIYSKFDNEKRLAEDFPDLAQQQTPEPKTESRKNGNMGVLDTDPKETDNRIYA